MGKISPKQCNLQKLGKDKKESMEREITFEELYEVVKKPKNNKSPGPDGFSNEFLKVFWPGLGTWLLKLMRFYKDTGTINKSQNRGIITCIPKGNKLRNNLKKLEAHHTP